MSLWDRTVQRQTLGLTCGKEHLDWDLNWRSLLCTCSSYSTTERPSPCFVFYMRQSSSQSHCYHQILSSPPNGLSFHDRICCQPWTRPESTVPFFFYTTRPLQQEYQAAGSPVGIFFPALPCQPSLHSAWHIIWKISGHSGNALKPTAITLWRLVGYKTSKMQRIDELHCGVVFAARSREGTNCLHLSLALQFFTVFFFWQYTTLSLWLLFLDKTFSDKALRTSQHVCMHLLHQGQREKQQCALAVWSLVDCEGLLDRDQARYSCWGICNRGSLSCGFGHAGSWKMAQRLKLFQECLVRSQGPLQTKPSVIVNLNHSLQLLICVRQQSAII